MFPPDSAGKNDGLLLRVWHGHAQCSFSSENNISGGGRNSVNYFAIKKSSLYQRLKSTTFAIVCRDKHHSKGERDYNTVEPLPGAPILTKTCLLRALGSKDLIGFQPQSSIMLHPPPPPLPRRWVECWVGTCKLQVLSLMPHTLMQKVLGHVFQQFSLSRFC